MSKLTNESELKGSLNYLREQLALVDAAIAALTRYRDTCQQKLTLPSLPCSFRRAWAADRRNEDSSRFPEATAKRH
ncbi:MAG TPA: hypothetical protein VFB14_14530 [Bryobacteraceae bacterium]|jgi:hypothetical protein|nr:hypothetical protein [Bryobacteraceae bacterium]